MGTRARITEFAVELKVCRREDPLSLLRESNSALYQPFEYGPPPPEQSQPIPEEWQMLSSAALNPDLQQQ